jgi:hypothetical protein
MPMWPCGYLGDMEEHFIVLDNTFPHHQNLSKIYIPFDVDKILLKIFFHAHNGS